MQYLISTLNPFLLPGTHVMNIGFYRSKEFRR